MPREGLTRRMAARPRLTGAQAATGAIAGLAEADVVVPLPAPMPDASYTVTAQVVLDDGGESLTVRRIRSKTATQVVVNVVNNAATSRSGTVHLMLVR